MTALLLAEPEASVRGFLQQQLTSDGFDVLAFESPDELPRAAEPDVLVLGDPSALGRCRVGDCPVIVLGRADMSERVRPRVDHDGAATRDARTTNVAQETSRAFQRSTAEFVLSHLNLSPLRGLPLAEIPTQGSRPGLFYFAAFGG